MQKQYDSKTLGVGCYCSGSSRVFTKKISFRVCSNDPKGRIESDYTTYLPDFTVGNIKYYDVLKLNLPSLTDKNDSVNLYFDRKVGPIKIYGRSDSLDYELIGASIIKANEQKCKLD